jgi:hypothetical protein
VWDLVRAQAPYSLMASLAGYEGFQGLTSPWFRAHWAVDGRELVEGTGALLPNERFIAASRTISVAEVVRPVSVLVNFMCPMASGEVAHVDTALFRGLPRGSFPTWLLVIMAASGLFEPWRVSTSGSITWFYDGPGGDYEYWPDGPLGAVERERAPFGNVAVVADNDRMYHRVSDVGRPEEWLPDGALPATAQLCAGDDGGWVVADGQGDAVHRYPPGAVRVSLLWKAMLFEDDRDAAAFDEQRDALTVGRVVDIFCRDLAAKGTPVARPADAFLDREWQQALWGAYPLGAPRG